MEEPKTRTLSASERWFFVGHIALAAGALCVAIARVLEAASSGRLSAMKTEDPSKPINDRPSYFDI